ncbi:dickkopf-related protein 3 [Leptodactylus fuscus]|uniref:dickkopf-related protein 3 n=1 Tax=Leptodactylus fuscus TaxID=238119 RepID=UPI003F4E5DDD
MLLIVLAVTLGLVVASPIQNSPDTDNDDLDRADPSVLELQAFHPLDEASLNDLFQEVEMLIKDTQSTLTKAVKELEAEESSEDKVVLKDLPPNYHNESVKVTKLGNATLLTKQEIVKETDNKTGSSYISETIISSLKSGDKTGHECIVDEDCRPGNYCQLSSFNYRCLPCKQEEMCTRDGECCEGQLCIWGQCKTSSKGESGAICETQQDCGVGLCCAVHTSLLFPVCTPMPGKGEQCQTKNPLLELFAWELESEVPVSHCPCPSDLVCRPQSHSLVSLCEDPSLLNTKDRPEITADDLPFPTPAPQEENVYEDGLTLPTQFGFDLIDSEDFDKESELVSQPRFVDYI